MVVDMGEVFWYGWRNKEGQMRSAYGVPVVDSAALLPRVVEELGIRAWGQTQEPMDLDRCRALLSEHGPLGGLSANPANDELRREVERFAPRAEVVFLLRPNGQPFRGFRSVGHNWVSVFATVPDPSPDLSDVVRDKWWNQLVPIIVEWKHGAEVIVIGPPCGTLEGGESPQDRAVREFEEETGFKLARVEQLTPEGLAVSARQTTQMYWPFFGKVQEPVERGKARLDETEDLKLILVRLVAWVDFILSGIARDDNAYATTFLALHKMGLLQVGYHPIRDINDTF